MPGTTRTESTTIDQKRRQLLGAAGAGAIVSATGGLLSAASRPAQASAVKTLRWGFVGTGGIANGMARMIQGSDHAELVAVSSRSMEKAQAFAASQGVSKAFDSWADMIAWDGVDAIYIATPTSVREEIGVAAANGGKHVLGEKPFANLPSVKRITQACRDNGVGFMDGTHFPHHPRTEDIQNRMRDHGGRIWSVASAFQFGLQDTSNIRLRPDLEPYGAIGDTGWYNMRAAVEYTEPGVEIESVDARMQRHPETGAAVSGSGLLVFNDGSTSTWNCGFQSGAGIQDLRISGTKGVIRLDDFLRSRAPDHTGSYEYRTGWADIEQINVPSAKPGATLMFENFAKMVTDPDWIEKSMRASERTQEWLDAAWESALSNEA